MPSDDNNPSPRVQYLEIDADRAGQRLDNFLLRELKGVPKTRIYRLLRKGEVRVNKGRCRPDYRLQLGDSVRLPPLRRGPGAPDLAAGRDVSWLEAHILYEDSHLIALNKPTGLAVHGGSGLSLGLIEALRALRPKERMLELVHRLDRSTSGCLLVAKKRASLLALHEQLRSGTVDKRYTALVRGRWQGKARRIEAALRRDQLRSGERQVVVDPQGKPAQSRFTPKQLYRSASLMEITLYTGRTHQARVHAAHSGHPIAGDEKYGDREFNQTMAGYGLHRLFLHASSLCFTHPQQACKMQVQAPLSAELSAVLDRLQHEEV